MDNREWCSLRGRTYISKIYIFYCLVFYLWSEPITTWTHVKYIKGSYDPVMTASIRNSMVSFADHGGNLKIASFRVDKGYTNGAAFGSPTVAGSVSIFQTSSPFFQRLFLYSTWGCIFFWGRVHSGYSSIVCCHLWMMKALVRVRFCLCCDSFSH